MNDSPQIICFCNNVNEVTLRHVIRSGCSDLNSIYEKTSAGVGPCGGTCRPNIRALITEELLGASDPAAQAHPTWVPPLELTQAISLFNRRYYWETHEVLEEVWLHDNGPTKLLYQGLIQAAAAFYHVLNANPRGVLKLAEEAQKKLSAYLPSYETLHLLPLVESLKDFIIQAEDILGKARSGFNYDRLPQISWSQDPLIFSKDPK